MTLLRIDIDPANVNLIGFASNVTGAAFVLTANDSGDELAHRVSIRNDSANDHSGKTVTLVGTDPDGKVLTEIVTGPAGSATVESAGYFLTLISATPSATIGSDTFDIGWVDEVMSRTYPLKWQQDVPSNFRLDVTGTISVGVEFTMNDYIPLANQSDAKWFEGSASLTAETTDSSALVVVSAGYVGFRVKLNSYTNTAELQLYATQAE